MTTHVAHPQPLSALDIIELAILVSPIVTLMVWSLVRLRRTRTDVRTALVRSGCHVVEMKMRMFRQGPFFWSTTRGQVVYHFVVRDTDGRERSGWARHGRRWLFEADKLEICWDDRSAEKP